MSDLQNKQKRISADQVAAKNQHGVRPVPIIQITGWYAVQVRHISSCRT